METYITLENLRFIFGIGAGLLSLAALVPYVIDILKGHTKPERTAYSIWAVTSGVTFFSYWAEGATDSLWLALAEFISGVLMLGLAIAYGYVKYTSGDKLGIKVAFLGIFLWIVTDEPFVALFVSIMVDAVGSALVVRKSYEDPSTEYLGSWLLDFSASIFAILAVGELSITLLFYPVYAFISSLAIVSSIILGRTRAANQ